MVPNSMCHHSIPQKLEHTSITDRSWDMAERLRLIETYELYSAAVYGALLVTIRCQDCASAVLVRTFMLVRMPEGERPKLHQLLRDAFAFSYDAMPEADRPEMKERIHGWFMQWRVRGVPSAVPKAPSPIA